MGPTDEQLAWLTLSRTGLDASALRSALEAAGSAAALIRADDGWCERAGVPPKARAELRQPVPPTRAELRWLDGPRHHLIPFTDPRYPRLLAGLHHRPVALYAAGNLDALGEPPFAEVGSRNPTRAGADTAFEFARALAERGLAIVSGLAAGIDTAAHRGALAAQGVTIAVLGSGADIVYPASNRELAESIQHEGLLLSGFSLGTPPRRCHFPRRNRVIAGLAKGILVVEAARGSGSLITARAAGDLGRPVFAVPGSIYNPLSRGCHELIKRGAKLAETADDILNGLNFSTFFGRGSGGACGAAPGDVDAAGMDKDHKILLDALGFDPADLDMLIARTGFKPEAVSSMMLILELEGHVQAAPGAATPESPTGELEVKDNVLDLLIYLFENYMSADDEPRPDRDTLKLELDKAGFAETDIERALEWLDGLSGDPLGKVAEATARAVRIFSGQELLRLDTDVRGYLMYLENVKILSGTQRELVIDRLMALEAEEIDIDQVKWVVLMVLFSQPGQESAYAQMEDLVFEERSDALH